MLVTLYCIMQMKRPKTKQTNINDDNDGEKINYN